MFIYSKLPSPERIGPEDLGNFRRDNCAAIDMSAIDKLLPIKYCLLINDFDKASNYFWSSKLSLEDKTTLEILLRFLKGNLSKILLTEDGISSGSKAVLRCGFSIADFIKDFLQVAAIVAVSYTHLTLPTKA